MRHTLGTAAGALVFALAGPVTTAQAGTGTLDWYSGGGNTGTVDNPEPHLCYELSDPEEPAIGGFNQTVFTATLYVDSNCRYTTGGKVLPNDEFSADAAVSVKFEPTVG
ncbi:hypothetical protein [Streptomyces avicenniae]|uniref:hypothetical protein n=1 Tax=Streptomyces avicenniae TaxID=500153 RepID=UPI00167D5020|nr:hypothetical protein [Streptomyces avicenniae]